MDAVISDKELATIKRDLIEQGLTYEYLQEDVLDHICCMVEEGLDSGKEFETSYQEVLSSIEENALKNIQHQTLLLLDNKFQKMKKTTYIAGLVGAIITLVGVLFKTMHWPGAGIMISLGFLLVAVIFLPFYFILNYREQAEKPKLVFPIVGFVSLAFILAGATFKIMHWPGANIMLKTSFAILLIGFLPLYIVQVFKKANDAKINVPYVIMLLIGISIVVLLGRVNISKNAIDMYTEKTIENAVALNSVEAKIEEMIVRADSMNIEKIDKIHDMTIGLLSQLEVMQNNLLQSVDQDGLPIDQVNGRDSRRAGNVALIRNGAGNAFNVSLKIYRDYLLDLLEYSVSDTQVAYNLSFGSGEWGYQWEPKKEAGEPLILHYHLLSEFALKIALSEYVAIQELMEK